ncbi:hypothetical protein SDC9_156177 [bioreactor metagenome]|uniref:Uncharacterized protein n=1 Tax=bioreactor metagenome TaxID=1076179 RepID=A0A645F635_9ZZZZ
MLHHAITLGEIEHVGPHGHGGDHEHHRQRQAAHAHQRGNRQHQRGHHQVLDERYRHRRAHVRTDVRICQRNTHQQQRHGAERAANHLQALVEPGGQLQAGLRKDQPDENGQRHGVNDALARGLQQRAPQRRGCSVTARPGLARFGQFKHQGRRRQQDQRVQRHQGEQHDQRRLAKHELRDGHADHHRVAKHA